MDAGDLRAGDADRERVAERLRLALDEGRLNLHEYDERLRDAYGAKTYSELDALLADLPNVTPPSQQRVVPASSTAAVQSGFYPKRPPVAQRALAELVQRGRHLRRHLGHQQPGLGQGVGLADLGGGRGASCCSSAPSPGWPTASPSGGRPAGSAAAPSARSAGRPAMTTRRTVH